MEKKIKISLPRGARKHIRHEKARIRREFLDKKEQEVQIKKVYEKFILNVGNSKK